MKPVPVYIDKHRLIWTQDLPPNGVAMTNEERRQELIEAYNRGSENRKLTKFVHRTATERQVWETAEDYLKEKGIV